MREYKGLYMYYTSISNGWMVYPTAAFVAARAGAMAKHTEHSILGVIENMSYQGLGCSPIKAVRELGSERRETVRSLSVVGRKFERSCP